MVNAAVVGYGYSGRAYQSYLIGLAEGLRLHAISTRDEGRQAEAKENHPDAKIYPDFDALLTDDDVDLIVLATPHDVHCDQAVMAMDAGKHLVTDKIMCMNASEAEEMIAARDRNNVLLSVFHNRRWDWDYLTVRKAIDDGLLGEPYLFKVGIMRYGSPRGWRGDLAQSGGILFDWPAHFVDQALLLAGAPVESVYCDVIFRDHWPIDIGNYGTMLIRFANGIRYQIEIGNLSAIGIPRWFVAGDLGTLSKPGLDPQEPFLRLGLIEDAKEPPEDRARVVTYRNGDPEERILDSVKGSWKDYYQNISDVLNQGAELIVTPEQVLKTMRVYDAAMAAAESGQTVSLN